MKICITANSGGHLNEIKQLNYIFRKYKHFYVTDKNKMSLELAEKEKVYFVQKFIFLEVLKKLKIHQPILNVMQSIVIFIREKPDIIVSTGAGTAFGMWFIGKLFNRKTIFIESAARKETPSIFGKFIGKKADVQIVQWKPMLKHFPKAKYGGIIFDFSGVKMTSRKKVKNIFITAGTYKLQFDRMFKEVDQLLKNKAIDADIIGQIGASSYIPQNYDYFDFCGQTKLHATIEQSDLIICQGGCGSIMDSLLKGKKVIAIPRLPQFGEYFDSHQIELVSALEEIGAILAIYDNIKELKEKIIEAETFKPKVDDLTKVQYDTIFSDYIRNWDKQK